MLPLAALLLLLGGGAGGDDDGEETDEPEKKRRALARRAAEEAAAVEVGVQTRQSDTSVTIDIASLRICCPRFPSLKKKAIFFVLAGRDSRSDALSLRTVTRD